MFRSAFAFVATVWWLVIVVHFGLAILTTVAGGQGSLPAVVVWIAWASLVANYFIRRFALRRWQHRRNVQRAQYWQNVHAEAARRNR
jgi:hypothetical protein